MAGLWLGILVASTLLTGRITMSVFDDQVRVFFLQHMAPIESIDNQCGGPETQNGIREPCRRREPREIHPLPLECRREERQHKLEESEQPSLASGVTHVEYLQILQYREDKKIIFSRTERFSFGTFATDKRRER
ncbi:hypothetical protein BV898_15134 [Hypsibius exemplaris]|uniref:Uncharacterized protein n=1 Tax=Hypsibius exemplaris TaxID=2072580 RepID=A0A9X6NCE4_HYPEX|nr:hypothetical protein BV898_15134 [Hypsibius exemplaris]